MKTGKKAFMMLFSITMLFFAQLGCSNNKKSSDIGNETTLQSEQNSNTGAALESPTTQESVQTEPTDGKSEITTITFAVPDFCHIGEERLELVNKELLKDGHPYQLNVISFEYTFEDDGYFVDVENELKTGNADVAFLGLGDSSNSVFNLINSGSILKLDDILLSDNGRAVYEAFPEALWESVKCNGHIYSLPNTNAVDDGIYAVFNKDYIDGTSIENWDGSIDSIYNMIKSVKWDDEAAPRFQYHLTDYYFEKMIGCDVRNGLVYDYDTMQIDNPLESKKFIGFLRVLDQMKRDGYLPESMTYFQNTSYAEEKENLKTGNFLVALDLGDVDELYDRDNLVIKRVAPYLSSRVNGSIGISSHTDHLDAVIDFLRLLYGGNKYGNMLLYGMPNEDFTIKDGLAVKMDGSDFKDDYLSKICMNLFVNVFPIKGERYAKDRKNAYFCFYDEVKMSPFIGFEPDVGSSTVISDDIDAFLVSLIEKPLDEAVREYSEKLKSDDMDAYLSSVKTQWEKYRQG